MTIKEIRNTIELIRIRRQEIAHSPRPSDYKMEYMRLCNEENELEQLINSRLHNRNIDYFRPGRG